VLGLPTRGRGGRDLILLTDGQVSNEGAVLALASKHAGTNRIFSFGIGSACSHYLVNGLAETTRGAAEFISGNERIEEKVLRTFSRLASPVLTDLSLDWGTGVRAEPAPAVLPPVFDGEPLTVYARLSGPGCTTLTLRGRLNGEPLDWTVPVTAAPDDGVLALLWARGAISDLEAALPADLRQPALRREPNQRRDVSRLVALSKRHGLLCSFTSFVAIEHRSPAERNEGRPALRRVPVQLAKGWHGIEVAAMAPLPAAGASDVVIERAFCMRHAAFREGVCNLVADSSCVSRLDRGPKYRLRPRPDAEGAAPPPRATAAAGLQALLATQGAVGWFEWQADTGDQLGFTREWLNQVRAELLQRFGLSGGTADKALADALLTLWLLRHRYGGDRGLWRRAADKALRAVVERLGLPRTEVEARLDSVTRPEPGVQ
jgi:hypothetical protein